jgi:hypothetical protein
VPEADDLDDGASLSQDCHAAVRLRGSGSRAAVRFSRNINVELRQSRLPRCKDDEALILVCVFLVLKSTRRTTLPSAISGFLIPPTRTGYGAVCVAAVHQV